MSQNYSQYLKHPVFKVASEIITERILEAYVIGGYVRDLLLDRPSKDIDIVVVGNCNNGSRTGWSTNQHGWPTNHAGWPTAATGYVQLAR